MELRQSLLAFRAIFEYFAESRSPFVVWHDSFCAFQSLEITSLRSFDPARFASRVFGFHFRVGRFPAFYHRLPS